MPGLVYLVVLIVSLIIPIATLVFVILTYFKIKNIEQVCKKEENV